MKVFKGFRSFTAIMASVAMVLGVTLSVGLFPAEKADAAMVSGSKFVGNIIAGGVPSDYGSYWNQVTPENSTKWGSVESRRGNMNWDQADMAYNYAKTNGMPFKFHTLVWGNQEPNWIGSLSASEQKEEVLEWIQTAAEKYPDCEFVDVVNEPLHAPASYKNAIGGNGSTGWDWVVWSFEQARKYFPNSKLLINDYGIIGDPNATSNYVEIINILKDKGLVDGIGIQCHQFNMDNVSTRTMNSVLDTLSATGLPIYVSELDITGDDNTQLSRYKEKFPVLWENPNVKGITLWGWIEGQTWIDNTHIISSSGVERPALTWLKSYLSSSNLSTTPPATPTPVVTGGNNTLLLGDVDENGSVNSLDFAKYRQYLLGKISYLPATGDVDRNNSMDSIDFGKLRQHLLGMIDLGTISLATPTLAPTPTPTSTPTPKPKSTLKVMPLGDSITDGVFSPGAYRNQLWKNITSNGLTVDFVGSMSNGGSDLGDKNHEGHSGWRIDEISNKINSWMDTYKPDIVLLHIGTNDISQNYDLNNAPNRLSDLIDKICNKLPEGGKLYVATVTPITYADPRSYNSQVTNIVQNKSSQGKPVYLVDMFNALTTNDLAMDGVHPNNNGYNKMGDTWFDAIKDDLMQ